MMQVSVAESQRDEALAQLKEYKAEVSVLSRMTYFQLIVILRITVFCQMEIRQAAIAERHESAMRFGLIISIQNLSPLNVLGVPGAPLTKKPSWTCKYLL